MIALPQVVGVNPFQRAFESYWNTHVYWEAAYLRALTSIPQETKPTQTYSRRTLRFVGIVSGSLTGTILVSGYLLYQRLKERKH